MTAAQRNVKRYMHYHTRWCARWQTWGSVRVLGFLGCILGVSGYVGVWIVSCSECPKRRCWACACRWDCSGSTARE